MEIRISEEDLDNNITTITGTMHSIDEGTTTTRPTAEQPLPVKVIPKRKLTIDNIPFGHVCDDIVIDNDNPYVQLYCQNVNGIFDREGIGLDATFKESNKWELIYLHSMRHMATNPMQRQDALFVFPSKGCGGITTKIVR
jgi:hypothetical protein